MGLLGDLVDDLVDIPVKIVKAPVRIGCGLMSHTYGPWRRVGNKFFRICEFCGAKEVVSDED
jgi:hypothetical protein